MRAFSLASAVLTAAAGLTVSSLWGITPPAPAAGASFSKTVVRNRVVAGTGGPAWRPSGIPGGGLVSQVAISPTDPARAIAVGDVSGAFWTSDSGLHWHSADAYARTEGELQLASVTWDPVRPGVAYALGGYPSPNSGLFMRTRDFGHTWTITTRNIAGLGDGVTTPLAATTGLPRSPRPLGRLIAVDDTNHGVYVGTFETGVYRASVGSDLGAATWKPVGLTPGFNGTSHWYIYALAGSTSNPDTLYAATHDSTNGSAGSGRIWRISDAESNSPSVTELSHSPVDTQDLLVLDGNLYAANAGGVWRLPAAATAGPATVFSRLPPPPTATAVDYWYSLAGYSRHGVDHLWVGGNASERAPLVQTLASTTSTDGFASAPRWSVWPKAASDVSSRLLGSGAVWWRTVGDSFRYGQPNGPESVTSIAVSPVAPSLVMTTDAYGVWRSTDAGANWRPSTNGLENTVNTAVATDPTNPKAVFVANMDSVFLESDNHGATFVSDTPEGAGATIGDAIAVDSTTRPSTVYLAVTQADGSHGEIWSKTGVFAPGSVPGHGWKQLLSAANPGLGAATGEPATGLALLRGSLGNRTLLTCLSGHGVWRMSLATHTWIQSQSSTKGIEPGLGRCQFAHIDRSSKVYLYDTDTGLWESRDGGATFTRIVTAPTDHSPGYIAIERSRPYHVFLSLESGVYQLSDTVLSRTGQNILQAVGVGVIRNTGPIAIANHHLVVAQLPSTSGILPRLFMANLDDLAEWSRTGMSYMTGGGTPTGIVESADGWRYESEDGQGLIERPPG